MRWSNVAVIFRREVRDQVRDRRTLFMIFVLPILLYPLLGFGMVQFAATLEQKPRIVVVVGAENLPKSPPLLNPQGNGFDPTLFDSPADAERLVVRLEPADGPWGDPLRRKQAIHRGEASAAMIVPRDLPEQLRREARIQVPIAYNSVDEPSQITYLRLREMLDRWEKRIVDARLEHDGKTESYAEPIQVRAEDVATPSEVGSSVWSRLFPFLLVIMALTGAFYPAVDLCAGEKERGTMETLLISPASRSEIVMGKFLTIMLASVMTALLNLVSMGLTGLQLGQSGRSDGGLTRPSGRRRSGGHARRPDPPGSPLDARAPDPAGGLLRRRLPGPGRAGAEHEGGPVLYDAAVPGQHAAHLPLAGAGDRAQPLLQPGPDHGGGAPAEGPDPGRL